MKRRHLPERILSYQRDGRGLLNGRWTPTGPVMKKVHVHVVMYHFV